MKLTPALLAKALTQVYTVGPARLRPERPAAGTDLGGEEPAQHHATTRRSRSAQPRRFRPTSALDPTLPLITGGPLGGQPAGLAVDPVGRRPPPPGSTAGRTPCDPVTADPDYVALKLGTSPATDQLRRGLQGHAHLQPGRYRPHHLQWYPRPGSQRQSCIPRDKPTESKRVRSWTARTCCRSTTNFDQAAATVLSGERLGVHQDLGHHARRPRTATRAGSGTVGTELAGQTFMWTVNDMPDLAAYGLISAALCDPSGATCVQPSTANVTRRSARPPPTAPACSQVNPAKVPSGAYPLVDVVYAAVPTNQSASSLTDYANFISYAARQGQTTGSAPGDLPPGYLPLTSSLQAQAQSVVTQLQALAGPTTTRHPDAYRHADQDRLSDRNSDAFRWRHDGARDPARCHHRPARAARRPARHRTAARRPGQGEAPRRAAGPPERRPRQPARRPPRPR